MSSPPEIVLVDGKIRGTVIWRKPSGVAVDVGHGIMLVAPERVTPIQ